MPRSWIFAIILCSPVFAEPVIGSRPGYLSSVENERKLKEEEIVLIPTPPPPSGGVLFGRPIFDARLTREFQAQYAVKFGVIEAERNLGSSNQFALFDYPGGKQETIEAHEKNQRKFGEFMFRRLLEHHVDQYAKSNPDIRPIYELKDRIANVNVQVRKDYKLKINYSYSGNYLDFNLENPYDVATKLHFEMGSGFGPSSVDRTILSLGHSLSKVTSVAAYQEFDRVSTASTLVGVRRLTKVLSSSISASINTLVDRDEPVTSQRHDIYLVGLTWTE